MQKPLLLCFVLVSLTGCTPDQNKPYREREARAYPDPTLGTDNKESQWYKTQILASPSAAGSAGAPVSNLPAKPAATPVHSHKPAVAVPAPPQG